MRNLHLLLSLILLALTTVPVRAEPPTTQPVAKHVLLIGLDGARADAIRDHAGPAIKSLIDSGTVCWQAQAVKPSVTQVNWASILTGCKPATHGIDMHPVTEEQLAGAKLKVPTLFDLVARDGKTAAGFLGHWKLYPNESNTAGATTFRSSYESSVVGPEAAAYIAKEKPAFCFVYLGDLDGLGHREGWMSDGYLKGVDKIDAAVGKLLAALDTADIRRDTVVILTSDHGGHGKSHAEGAADDLAIPWIAAGPGIARGRVISRPISTTETAPTILQVLGVPLPKQLDGKSVVEAFADSTNTAAPLPAEPGDTMRGGRVMVVSIDGLRPDLALRADMPNMRQLLKTGAYTFWARTTDVAITLPSHTSMMTGVTPARHGIDWNDDAPEKSGRYPNFPTLFELARKAGYTTAMVSGKSKFQTLAKPGTLDWADYPDQRKNARPDAEVADRAATLIADHSPHVMLVHFGEVDRVGHGIGWATPEQITAIEGADTALGKVLDALRKSGKYDQTLIILTADHGGFAKTHGNGDYRSANIPWIAVGPGVRKNFDLTRFKAVNVRTEDTFATACQFLGLTPAADIDGHWVQAAFDQVELLSADQSMPTTKPSTHAN